MISKVTPCAELNRCYYEEWHFDKRLDQNVKCCRVLDSDKAPYKTGECPFYKNTKASYSGSYAGEEYSRETIDYIRNQEYEYKVRHGIIGKKGKVG